MLRRILMLAVVASLLPLAGCLAIGNGHGRSFGVPTIAEEIKELKEAKSSGEITEQEFHAGMSSLSMGR